MTDPAGSLNHPLERPAIRQRLEDHHQSVGSLAQGVPDDPHAVLDKAIFL